jgi:hypothetical protein
MRLTHEQLNTDIIDMELIELKFMFDRCMYCYSVLGWFGFDDVRHPSAPRQSRFRDDP